MWRALLVGVNPPAAVGDCLLVGLMGLTRRAFDTMTKAAATFQLLLDKSTRTRYAARRWSAQEHWLDLIIIITRGISACDVFRRSSFRATMLMVLVVSQTCLMFQISKREKRRVCRRIIGACFGIIHFAADFLHVSSCHSQKYCVRSNSIEILLFLRRCALGSLSDLLFLLLSIVRPDL